MTVEISDIEPLKKKAILGAIKRRAVKVDGTLKPVVLKKSSPEAKAYMAKLRGKNNRLTSELSEEPFT